MLSTKVIALNINNLTDARYFAAWGIDMMAFNIGEDSSLSPEEIIEIINWIEGPEYLIQIDKEVKAEMLFEFLSKTKIGKLVVSADQEEIVKSNFPNVECCVLNDKELKYQSHTFMLVSNESSLQSFEKSNYQGIVVSGGDEEKAGFKDFDKLDKIFENLEQL